MEQHHQSQSPHEAGHTRKAIKKLPNYLFVDDDPYILDLFKQFFAGKATITVAQNGTKALGKISSQHFDAIVSDVEMPGINGIYLFKQLHKADPTTRKRFIFCTGSISTELRKLSDLYQVGIVSKPIEFKLLEDTLARITPSPQAA